MDFKKPRLRRAVEDLGAGRRRGGSVRKARARRGRLDLVWDVLREFDSPDIGYQLLSAEGYPSPINMLTGGRTTLTEGLDGSGSGCHCMFASPDTYFYRTLCGVSVDRRKRVPLTVRPYCPEDMTGASCTQTLDEGTLSVRWERTENGISFSVAIPAGLTADVLLKNGAHEYKDPCAEGNISVVL